MSDSVLYVSFPRCAKCAGIVGSAVSEEKAVKVGPE